jgi:type I restriction enzyme S subunit
MNPERLLQQFDRIIDSPDSIPRLRRFIFDLAVHGKLVEQVPNDEPASELLKRIEVEKAWLVKETKSRREDVLPLVGENSQPFFAPAGWLWERLANVSRKIHYGFTASADTSIREVRLLRITDIQDNSVNWDSVPGCEISDEQVEQFKLEKGDILIARTGGTIGKSFLVREIPIIAVFASYLIRVQGSTHLCHRYLKLFLESTVYWKQLEDGARGAGQPNVNGQALGRMMIPVPPLAEQHRIVAKVDELMRLCDRLEAAQAEREHRRDRLVAASLRRLTFATEPDQSNDFREHCRFCFNHISRLTTRRVHIKQLRDGILNLAIRGNLVPQDPNDEPASELLGRIRAEKERLMNERKIRKGAPQPPLVTERLPFSVPFNWEWIRLGDLCFVVTDGTHYTPKYLESGLPFLSVKDVSSGRLDFSNTRMISAEEHKELSKRCKPELGDILLTKVGTTGIGVVVDSDREFSIFVSLALLKFSQTNISSAFLALLINSPMVKKQSEANTQGIGNKNLVLRLINGFHLPIPPLAEQHRIAAKVDELMALCDQLEAQLTATRDDSRRLLEAVLHEALHSADEKEV